MTISPTRDVRAKGRKKVGRAPTRKSWRPMIESSKSSRLRNSIFLPNSLQNMPASKKISKKKLELPPLLYPKIHEGGFPFINSRFSGLGYVPLRRNSPLAAKPRSFAKWRQGAHTYRSTGLSALVTKGC